VEEAARGAHEPAFVAARVDRQRPWSDLFDFHETGSSVEDIADYLCRTVEEIQAKIDPDRGRGPLIAALLTAPSMPRYTTALSLTKGRGIPAVSSSRAT
jgi:hypothetical protein